MFTSILTGCISGIFSGTLFALCFAWQFMQGQEGITELQKIPVLVIPAIYGSVFSVAYALVAACGVAFVLKVLEPVIANLQLKLVLTGLIITCAAYSLWQSPTPSHATMIESQGFRICSFLAAAIVTQATYKPSDRSHLHSKR